MSIEENLFLSNKYTRWYFQIIENAKNQNRKKLKYDNPDCIYYEKHHIILNVWVDQIILII